MNAVSRYRNRRIRRLESRFGEYHARFDDDEEENVRNGGGKSSGGHGNTRIPFGLCQREGIQIDPNWTPKDAWKALEGKGYSAGEVYKELKKTGKAGSSSKKVSVESAKESLLEAKKRFKELAEHEELRMLRGRRESLKLEESVAGYQVQECENELKEAEERNRIIGGRKLKQIDEEIKKLEEELDKYSKINDKLFEVPRFGTPEREEWDNWLKSLGGRAEVEEKIYNVFSNDDDSVKSRLENLNSAGYYFRSFGADGGLKEAKKSLEEAISERDKYKREAEDVDKKIEDCKKIIDDERQKIEPVRKAYADAVKEKYPTFSDCHTVEEVKQRLDCEGYFKEDDGVDFGQLNLYQSIRIANDIDGFFSKHEMLRGKLERAAVRRLGARTYAKSGWNGVELNDLYYGDKWKADASFERCVQSGFHPPGLSFNSVIYHEYTHQIDKYLTRVLNLKGARGNTKDFSTVVFEEVRKKLKMKARECKEAVSEYSWNNKSGGASEWLAEAYSEYLCSESPRAVAMEVGRVVTRYLNEL